MNPSILVTGGAGYIGSHTVVELAQNGYYPIIIDDLSNSEESVLEGIDEILGGRKYGFYRGDCADLEFMKSIMDKESHVIGAIHFAAFKAVGESVIKPLDYYDNNLNTLISLLRLCVLYKIDNFVFSSSCTVYGQTDGEPVSENSSIKPAESPYGKTKQFSEEIIKDFVHSIAIQDLPTFKAVALRYFNPIGAHPSSQIGELPRGVPNNLVPYVTQSAAGQRGPLTIYGGDYNTPDGTCLRDFIHVVDLAKAHVSSINFLNKESSTCFKAYNVGTGKATSVMQVVNAFEKVTGKNLDYQIGARRPGDIEQIYADVSLAENDLGWSCVYDLEDALSHAWKWQEKISHE